MYTILHAIGGYFFLLLTVRVLTRRPGAQMTPFEFVLIFLIGGVVILATLGNDHSEINSVCAVITVGLMHRLVSAAKQRYPRLGAIVDGTPVVLMKNDEWQTEVMQETRVDDNDVMAAARGKGLKKLGQIDYAILERNGTISIIKKED
ncbi:MAG TPA: YetF domain-containing protein [Bryobacteraceae bacterium]|nr:YetF domain-containing protein [Bryobacteraceae bacterium]